MIKEYVCANIQTWQKKKCVKVCRCIHSTEIIGSYCPHLNSFILLSVARFYIHFFFVKAADFDGLVEQR